MPLQQFTWPLASAGIFLVLFSLLFYPWMIEKYSPKVLCQFGMIGLAPMAIMLPLASLIKSNYIVQQVSPISGLPHSSSTFSPRKSKNVVCEP